MSRERAPVHLGSQVTREADVSLDMVMHRFASIALMAGLAVACADAEKKMQLVEPSFAAAGAFKTVRMLTNDQIAKSVFESEEKKLADQLLGLNKKPVETIAMAPKPKRRRARPADDFVDDQPWAEEEDDDGVLTDSMFQDTIEDWRGMRSCVAQATLRANERSGALQVSFRIRGDGEVAACKVIDTSNAIAQAVAPCVERRARRIRFPAFGGEEDVTKVAKFVF